MVEQPDSPPNASDSKTQNPVVQLEATNDGAKDIKSDPVKDSATSVFVNSKPIREDQVQNAVKFLSHPKVRGSPVLYRRSFLERKGLTKEEIDEAFRRVPDPTPPVSTSQPVVANQDASKVSPTSQPQVLAQAQPPSKASSFGTLSQLHWTHALLAVGLLAASGAGTAVLFKKSIIPRLKSWIRKVVLEEEAADQTVPKNKPSLEEEATAAAKAAAAAAADVARTSQEMLMAKTEEKRYFEELTNLLNVQVREMKSMTNALQKLEGQRTERLTRTESDDQRIFTANSKQLYTNGQVDVSDSVKSSAPPATVEPSVAPHPKSYMDIMAMVQRGERPSNIRDINDQPPNPNQPVPNPRLVPKPKPWEVGQSQTSTVNGVHFQESASTVNPIPWSQINELNGNGSSAPWSQHKNVSITELEADDNGQKSGSSLLNERPVQRSWVPPQPPPVVMPEAAAAIRQPKKPPAQKQQLTDDQLLARSSEISDELQRVTEISESGGIANHDGIGSHAISSSEIQQEDGTSYFET